MLVLEKILRFYGSDLQDIDFEAWLEQKPVALHTLAKKWHEEIAKLGLDVDMIFHDDCPIGCVEEAPFAYVNVYSKHVNLGFFYGVDLPDPHGLLVGTGKRMRHIKLYPDESIDDEYLRTLLKHAYLDIKERLL